MSDRWESGYLGSSGKPLHLLQSFRLNNEAAIRIPLVWTVDACAFAFGTLQLIPAL